MSGLFVYERVAVSERKQGAVKWFNTEKGYGFILSPEGEDVFVHYRSIQVEGFKNLREGQEVSFLQIKSEKGWQAAEVELLANDFAGEAHSDMQSQAE